MSNLDYHYQTLGRILAFLVEHGLRRMDIDASDVMEIMTERQGNEEEVISTFSDVMHWMESEGLIRANESLEFFGGGFAYSGVQLTSRGVAIVQFNLGQSNYNETIAEKVTNKREELDASAYTKIGAFVGGILGGFTTSIT